MTSWVQDNHDFLSAALAVLAARLDDKDVEGEEQERDRVRDRMSAPPALHRIAESFGLSDFERDTLLLCAGVELDASVAAACARAHGEPARRYATFSLAMSVLPEPHWSAVTPAGALRRWHLLEPVHPESPTTTVLRVDERMLHALAGLGYLDPRVECLAGPLPPADDLPPALRRPAERLAAQWSGPGPRRVRLRGRSRADLRSVVAAAAGDLGLQPLHLRAADLPAVASERTLLARICDRESVLSGRCWLLETDDAAPEAARWARDLSRELTGPVVIAGDEPLAGDEPVLIDVPTVPPAELRTVWQAELGGRERAPDSWPARLAGQFALGVADIRAVIGDVAAGDPATRGPDLWAACRSRVRPALDGLAQRVEARAGWKDLVLPEPQARLLRDMTAQSRNRMTVFEDWGFGSRGAYGTGTAALFAGSSGTGKTFAAEVIAADLALDLYRVDLSQVVSKYIGETEKNLRRVFDVAETGGVVLVFDEADALFGKRSDVKDSHDRYANIEVSYLLQRMESYRGLAILTTNRKDAIDTAFIRRLRFIVRFPFPDAAGRAGIWQRLLPPELPTEGLRTDLLARLEVSGGTIRNIALAAAFLAAESGEPVRMRHLLRAARTEYAKQERPLTDAEVAGWTT
ncbi:MAG TPA: ATP-binding protein [Actinoplanes sp.]|jgi:hypothetical protein